MNCSNMDRCATDLSATGRLTMLFVFFDLRSAVVHYNGTPSTLTQQERAKESQRYGAGTHPVQHKKSDPVRQRRLPAGSGTEQSAVIRQIRVHPRCPNV
jgi:hypothetical protein